MLVNPISAWLALAANLFYVFVYSMLLKRRTSQNVVWGGLAGCFPTLIGWTAVTGELAWPPVILFLVVFLWTPPHTWALAMRYREDYAAAKSRCCRWSRSERTVARQIVLYSLGDRRGVAAALAGRRGPGWSTRPWPARSGLVFAGGRAPHAGGGPPRGDRVALAPMRLFHLSNAYLAILFAAVAIDPLLF